MTSNKPESPDHETKFFCLNEEDNGHKLRCKTQCKLCPELEPPANSPAPDKEDWKEKLGAKADKMIDDYSAVGWHKYLNGNYSPTYDRSTVLKMLREFAEAIINYENDTRL